MKKWLLAPLFVLPLLAAWFIPKFLVGRVPTAQVVSPQTGTYHTYLNFSGGVEYLNTQEISFSLPVLAGQVFVKPGDMVRQGDVLFTVDKLRVYELLQEEGIDALPLPQLLTSYQPILEALSALENGISLESIVTAYQEIPSTVTAPTNGMVTTLEISTSALSNPAQPVAAVSPVDSLCVKISVPEEKISQLSLGQRALITCSAFPDHTYYGTLAQISPLARKIYSGTTQSTVVDAYLKLDNPDGNLKPGYTAKVKVHVQQEDNALILPYSTLLPDENGKECVYVWEKGYAQPKPVTCLHELESGEVAVTGVNRDDLVILHPEDLQGAGSLVIPTWRDSYA